MRYGGVVWSAWFMAYAAGSKIVTTLSVVWFSCVSYIVLVTRLMVLFGSCVGAEGEVESLQIAWFSSGSPDGRMPS